MQLDEVVGPSLSVHDAQELAPEFADPPPTEIKREEELVLTPDPVNHILKYGHKDPAIMRYVDRYIRPHVRTVAYAKREIEKQKAERLVSLDESAITRLSDRLLYAEDRAWARINLTAYMPSSDLGARETKLLSDAARKSEHIAGLVSDVSMTQEGLERMTVFFSAVMHGKITPGTEAFGRFLLDRFGTDVYSKEYIRLKYCQPLPAYIFPYSLAQECGCLASAAQKEYDECKKELEKERDKKIADISARYAKEWEDRLAIRTRYQEYRRACMLSEMKERQQRSPMNCGVDQLVNMYIILEMYPSVRECILPFLTSMFDHAWLAYFGASHGSDRLAQLRQRIRDAKAYKRDYDKYQYQHFKRPFFKKESIDIRYTEYQARYLGPLFEESTLDSFVAFVKTYGEGVYVVHSLFHPLYLGPWGNFGYNRLEKVLEYTSLTALDVPVIAGRQPFEILETVERLSRVLTEIKDRVDHLTHFWVADGIDLYGAYDRQKEGRVREHWSEYRYDWTWYADVWAWIRRCNDHPMKRYLYGTDLISGGGDREERELREMTQRQYQTPQSWERDASTRPERKFMRGRMKGMPMALCGQLLPTYVECRAADAVLFGEEIADKTFPMPDIHADSLYKWEMINLGLGRYYSRCVQLLNEVRRNVHEAEEAKWKAEMERRKTKEVEAVESRHATVPVPAVLPAQALSEREKVEVLEFCEKKTWQAKRDEIDDLIRFCELLAKPDNHIKVPSGQSTTREVPTRTFSDMNVERAQVLSSLPRHTAYAKLVAVRDGHQVIIKQKIKTSKLANISEEAKTQWGRQRELIENNSRRYLKEREEIEKEIRARQKPWRGRGRVDTPPPSKSEIAPPPGREESLPQTPLQPNTIKKNDREEDGGPPPVFI